MAIIKRLFLIVFLIIAILVMYWFYLRVTLGEGGCSVETTWLEEKELEKGIKKSQFNESNVITINYLTPNFSYYSGGEYMSEVYFFSRKTTKVHINNLSIKYIFDNRELQPTRIQLTRFNNKTAKIVSDQRLQNKEISNISLNNGEKTRITYIFDEDDVVFNKGEVSFTYEYTENELSRVIDRKIPIVKVISKYNCLWMTVPSPVVAK